MKKMIFLLSFIAATAGCLAQTTGDPKPVMDKNYYRQKSKSQKTAAFVLLGVGAALDIAGIITTVSNANKELDGLFGTTTSVNHTGEYVLYIAGTAALGTSLALFISAKRNKTRAATLSFKNEMAPQLKNTMVFNKLMPALSFKITL